MYCTQHLRTLLRAKAEHFERWGIDFLVNQLYDESKLVAVVALDILDEACDSPECLQAILRSPPTIPHLGDRGHLLLIKLLASPQGFKTYSDSNFITDLLNKWATTYNVRYVKMIQTAMADSVTQHQRGDDGSYGRRTGASHVVHDVFCLPHLYGSLTSHKDGFSVLTKHEHIKTILKTLKGGKSNSISELFELKAAIWAVGHIGLSSDGISFLEAEDAITSLANLASHSPVYSVRGTCFHAFCLLATTWEGANIIKKHGWESVRRNHHEKWQFINNELLELEHLAQYGTVDENFLTARSHLLSENDTTDQEFPSKAGFYVGDESEEESDMNGLLIEGIGLSESYPTTRKSQTLPQKSKPPSGLGHHRSLSDPVAEELNSSEVSGTTQPSEEWGVVKRGSLRLKNKILASMRRKSTNRRESTSSKASNTSNTSDRLNTIFRLSSGGSATSRSRSLTDPLDSEEDSPDRHIPAFCISSGNEDKIEALPDNDFNYTNTTIESGPINIFNDKKTHSAEITIDTGPASISTIDTGPPSLNTSDTAPSPNITFDSGQNITQSHLMSTPAPSSNAASPKINT